MRQQTDDPTVVAVTAPPPVRSRGSMILGRIWGVELRVDQSWLLVAFLVVWSFWMRFTSGAGHHRVGAAVVMAVVAAGLFFSSVLAHELAHAVEARRRGLRVGGITLHLFGGTTAMTSAARRPRDELALTVVGPYTSLVLASALGLVAYAGGHLGLAEVAEVSGTLGWINLMLAVFNLLPGAPLDGGRILAAVVWGITGDRHRAGVVAARAGRILGAVLLTAGLFETFFVLGGLLGGLWLVFLGWFLYQSALGEEHGMELERLVTGRRAEELVVNEAEAVDPGARLGWMAHALFRTHHLEAVPVEDHGRTVGIVTVDDVARVAPEQRFQTTAGEVMRPIGDVPCVAASDPALAALVAVSHARLVAITEGDTVVAILTAGHIADALERLHLLERVPVEGAR
jgi:Zn-dependent protease/CBS domain-containing protein